jgi:hypothetical protein
MLLKFNIPYNATDITLKPIRPTTNPETGAKNFEDQTEGNMDHHTIKMPTKKSGVQHTSSFILKSRQIINSPCQNHWSKNTNNNVYSNHSINNPGRNRDI